MFAIAARKMYCRLTNIANITSHSTTHTRTVT